MHAESATGICGLLPYTCGLMSSWGFVLVDSVLGDFVLGAFVRIPWRRPCGVVRASEGKYELFY